MAKFENMTLSYTQIASIPFKTRKSASGSLLDALSRDLTPGQRVALFPSYVNQVYASGGVKDGESVTPPVGGGGSSDVPPTVEKAGPPRPGKGLTTTREIIPGGLIFGPDGKPVRVPDQQKLAANAAGFTPRERAVLDMISRREGSPNPDIIFGDVGGKPGSGKYSRALGLDKKPLSKMTVAEVFEIMPKLRAMTKADGYGKLGDGSIVGTSAVGSGQMIEGTLRANLKALGIKPEDYDKTLFDGTLQDKLTLSNFRTSIGDPNDDPSKWNKTQLGNQYESFNVNRGFSPLSTTEMETVRQASPDMPIGPDDEFSRLPNVYDIPEAEIEATATAEPIKTRGAISYDELRSEFPDIIDEDSDIWDKLDPTLKDNKSMIVDVNGRKVGRETLIAADAAAKVLRKNGLTPRIVSGGDEHSKNHGEGTSVNRSIDVQAYDAKGGRVHLGQVDPQIRKDMLTASQLSVKGENFRIGIPTDNSNTGMHIQSDPDFEPAIWGYSEGQSYSRETLKNRNPEYINLWERNNELSIEDREEKLASLIGPTVGAEEPAPVAETATSEPVVTASSTPLEYTDQGKPIDPDTGYLLSEDDPRYPKTAKTIPKPTETATANPQPQRISLREGMGGYSAAAGGAEITDPSMIISEDGKKVTRVAETGPEKLSVMPRHKSSDVFQENQILMQEARQEQAREEAAKPDIATVKSSQQMSDFGRSKDTGQSIAISTVMPRITPSANKAFADAKMVGRFNKAGIDGDMGIVYIDRGYA